MEDNPKLTIGKWGFKLYVYVRHYANNGTKINITLIIAAIL